MRSIQPLGCSPVAKHEERGRLPTVGRDDPARWRLFDCQVSGGQETAAPPGRAASFGLLPPARDYREPTVMVVDHLLDVIAVVAVVAEVQMIAAVSNGVGNWRTARRLIPALANRCVARVDSRRTHCAQGLPPRREAPARGGRKEQFGPGLGG